MAGARNALSGAHGEDHKADERLCQMIAKGGMEPEYLDRDYLSKWEERSELQVIDICGGCVVEIMQDQRRDLATEGHSIGTMNDVAHRRAVSGAMTEYMSYTFKLPLH